MRTGKEREEWERLSYSLATSAAVAGAKNVKMQSFNKFKVEKDPKQNRPDDVKRMMTK